MANMWFVVSVIGFTILLFVFVFKNIAFLLNGNSVKKIKKGIRGTIRNVKYAHKGILKSPVTVFEVYDVDDNIFYLGIDGHIYLREGGRIEFWKSNMSVANTSVTRSKTNDNDILSSWTKKKEYYAMKKYRIIDENENLDTDDAIATVVS